MKKTRREERQRKLTFMQRKEIIKQHFENGISQKELAKIYGVSRFTINRHCQFHGKSPILKSHKFSNEQIKKMFVEEFKSVARISIETGLHRRGVIKKLKEEGIDYRPKLKRKKFEKEVPHYRMRLKIWEAKVIERDGMKCKWCEKENSYSNRLEAHHILPVRFIDNPDDLFSMENGITLCNDCHLKIHYRELEYADFFRELLKR